MSVKAEQLKTLPIFYGIDEQDLPTMLHCLGSFERTYQKNEMIFLENDDIRNVGILLSGKVHMVKEDAHGHSTLLVSMSRGELFGESFACGTMTDSKVCFIAAEPCHILFLPFHKVLHTCRLTCNFHHRLIENMVTLISEKNVQLMVKMDIISRKNLQEKILAYLYTQAPNPPHQPFTIPLGRIALADYLCADRSALTRALAQMKKEGLIDYEKNTFRLLDTM
ncbi:MAG: Crp/Fnr family transcriptional regulator [Peptococcaceae bacterium]|nr:Crp/Fnr family transcriptional regulator [Peptococcaceae bacterium]